MTTWQKIKRALALAVALVAAGVALPLALRQGGEEAGVTRPEWCTAVERLNDVQGWSSFYAALPDGVTPPADKIGTCADGICTMAPQGVTECPIVYEYQRGPLVAGWRVWTVRADSHVAGYLRRWVLDTGGRWYESQGQVVGACLSHFTPAQCRGLLGYPKGLWLLASGDYCREGFIQRNHGPGDSTPVACNVADIIAPLTEPTTRGAGGELAEVQQAFAADDYEEPAP